MNRCEAGPRVVIFRAGSGRRFHEEIARDRFRGYRGSRGGPDGGPDGNARLRPPAGPGDFDFLEGKWNIVYNNSQPGIPPNLKGTWTATKQADGRVLYDEFRILGPNGDTVSLGASYRVFDHVRKQWDCRYVQLILPGDDGPRKLANWATFTAWPEGKTLRVDQHGDRGALRITYYDIGKDHFRWKADASPDGGKTWQADAIRIEATRAP